MPDYPINEDDNRIMIDRRGTLIRSYPARQADWVDPRQINYTKQERPYGYSEFFHWKTRPLCDLKNANYSDRLFQANYTKCRELNARYRKQFQNYSQNELSDWLTEYFGRKCIATALAEGCNVSSGYPYYILWFDIEGEWEDETVDIE